MKYIIEGRDSCGDSVPWNKVTGFVADNSDDALAYFQRLKRENRLHRKYRRYCLHVLIRRL